MGRRDVKRGVVFGFANLTEARGDVGEGSRIETRGRGEEERGWGGKDWQERRTRTGTIEGLGLTDCAGWISSRCQRLG